MWIPSTIVGGTHNRILKKHIMFHIFHQHKQIPVQGLEDFVQEMQTGALQVWLLATSHYSIDMKPNR